jgi:hypothetical protein
VSIHEEAHPLAGETVTVNLAGPRGTVEVFVVEDYWDRIAGKSWMFSDGNPAAMKYAMRSGLAGLPTDNEVVYGKIGAFGHLIHTSEFVEWRE